MYLVMYVYFKPVMGCVPLPPLHPSLCTAAFSLQSAKSAKLFVVSEKLVSLAGTSTRQYANSVGHSECQCRSPSLYLGRPEELEAQVYGS